jgi:hypothetical protein
VVLNLTSLSKCAGQKVRWVVEEANARIKRWKYFANILPTNQVPYISENTKIICAICNKFFPPLSSGAAEEVLFGRCGPAVYFNSD